MSHKSAKDRGKASDDVRVVMRNYFSSYHLWAAKAFADDAKRIETAHTGENIFDIRHRALVINSILSSTAFLEAAINEIYKDASDRSLSYVEPLGVDVVKCLGEKRVNWNPPRKNRKYRSVIVKYQEAMKCCGLTPFDREESPCEDVARVVGLRNAITHFAPDDLSAEDPHELGDVLEGRFPENRLMEGGGNPFFPDKCLGAGCAHWAYLTAKKFADEFFSQMNITPSYQRVYFETGQ